jgi:ABC-type transport system involved in cytochrome bd biosynthesis fused ATPase/permease subunit
MENQEIPAAIAAAKLIAGRKPQLVTGLMSLRMAARLGFAGLLAVWAGKLIEAGEFDAAVLLLSAAAVVVSVLMGLAASTCTATSELRVATGLLLQMKRTIALGRVRRLEELAAGQLVAGTSRHPAAVARLVIGHAAARVMLAVGPVLAAGAIFLVSWQAAVILLLAIPILIVFFTLLGGMIAERARIQEVAFGRLATQFADRIRVLPTIVANHQFGREEIKLDARMRAYGRGVISLITVAFLNAGILDFFSSLSIAVLAVCLGLGHLGLLNLPGLTNLTLSESLLILVITPEFFGPFRRYAEQYHAKAEGLAAAEAMSWALTTPLEGSRPDHVPGAQSALLWPIGAIDDFSLPAIGLVAIIGSSGSGKTTLLRALAGVDTPVRGTIGLGEAARAAGVQWVGNDSLLRGGTIGEAIGFDVGTDHRGGHVLDVLGLARDPFLAGGLETELGEGGAELSGGQRVRLAVARALAGHGTVLCDEPTAKLDHEYAERVRQALRTAAMDRLVIVATHDPALIDAADQVIALTSEAVQGLGRAA